MSKIELIAKAKIKKEIDVQKGFYEDLAITPEEANIRLVNWINLEIQIERDRLDYHNLRLNILNEYLRELAIQRGS